MSVAIRLQRHGTKKKPFYKIVITDKRAASSGAFIERIGHYDPGTDPINLDLKKERYDYWISKGATPSPTINTLLKKVSN
jgi:small subunit ribosomal protein S16